VIRAHQPGSEPIDIPEAIPNPVVVPKPTRTPTDSQGASSDPGEGSLAQRPFRQISPVSIALIQDGKLRGFAMDHDAAVAFFASNGHSRP
jgi:hypothetical protein